MARALKVGCARNNGQAKHTYIPVYNCRHPRLGYVWKICMTSRHVALLNVCLCTPMTLCGLSSHDVVWSFRPPPCLTHTGSIAFAAPMARALKVGCARNGQAKHTYIPVYSDTVSVRTYSNSNDCSCYVLFKKVDDNNRRQHNFFYNGKKFTRDGAHTAIGSV